MVMLLPAGPKAMVCPEEESSTTYSSRLDPYQIGMFVPATLLMLRLGLLGALAALGDGTASLVFRSATMSRPWETYRKDMYEKNRICKHITNDLPGS